jgi:hypothetical protein
MNTKIYHLWIGSIYYVSLGTRYTVRKQPRSLWWTNTLGTNRRRSSVHSNP